MAEHYNSPNTVKVVTSSHNAHVEEIFLAELQVLQSLVQLYQLTLTTKF